MNSNLRYNVTGTLATIVSYIGALSLERVNQWLQFITFVITIIIGSMTLLNLMRHKDIKAIKKSIDEIDNKLP